jgi:hypothetical protein
MQLPISAFTLSYPPRGCQQSGGSNVAAVRVCRESERCPMLNRFLSTDLGREILARSNDLKIHLYRCRGQLAATYELSGSVGRDPFRDGDDDDDEDQDEGDLLLQRKQSDAEDMRFIIDLLNQFEKVDR